MGSRMDFHGDGADSEVEVVGADGYLPIYPNISGRRYLQEQPLIGSSDRERPLSGLGGAVVLRLPVPGDAGQGRLADTLVSRRGERPALGGAESGHPDPVRITTAADFKIQLGQAPDDGRTAEADFPAHLQYALAAGMAPTEVVQVNRLTGDHLVYNLSTSDHWFTGNGIALHNCRCTMLLVEEDEIVDLSNRQFRGSR